MEQSATHGSDPDPLRITADPALVRAIGGALTVFATLMARKGIESLEETANLLGIYAVLTDEIAPDEALILGCWAGMLRDAAEGISVESTNKGGDQQRSEEHTSELQSLMRISYAVFCLKKKKKNDNMYCSIKR